MKIAIFGASGKIGSQIVSQLEEHGHEVIKISRSGDIAADYTNEAEVRAVFEKTPNLDAVVVSVGGDSVFKPYETLTDDDFRFGAERKLVAQFKIVRFAQEHLNDNGSITLTSGFLSHYPNPYSLATGPFNSAIDTYVRQAAPLLKRGLRLNAVSPAPIVAPERADQEGLISAEQCASFYVNAIKGHEK